MASRSEENGWGGVVRFEPTQRELQERINAEARKIYEAALKRTESLMTSAEIFEAGWNACYRACHPPMGPSGKIHDTAEAAFRELVESHERPLVPGR